MDDPIVRQDYLKMSRYIVNNNLMHKILRHIELHSTSLLLQTENRNVILPKIELVTTIFHVMCLIFIRFILQ